MKFSIQHNSNFDFTNGSFNQWALVGECELENPAGLKSLSYSKSIYFSESSDVVTHSNIIEFYDIETAQRFYEQMKFCIAAYAAHRGLVLPEQWKSTFFDLEFPAFMAAFTILVSDPDRYGVPREALTDFRNVAPLDSLPDPRLIKKNFIPGTLVPQKDGNKHWTMSSLLEGEIAENQKTASSRFFPAEQLDIETLLKQYAPAPKFDMATFLKIFSVAPGLIKTARFGDRVINCCIEFPGGINSKELTELVTKLKESGFSCNIEEAYDHGYIKAGPTIEIKGCREALETWMKEQMKAPQELGPSDQKASKVYTHHLHTVSSPAHSRSIFSSVPTRATSNDFDATSFKWKDTFDFV